MATPCETDWKCAGIASHWSLHGAVGWWIPPPHHAVSIWLAETPCNSMARTLNIGQQRLGYSARARRLVSSCGTRALILRNMVVCIHPFSQTNIMIWLHFSSFTQLKGEHLEYCARMYVYGKDLQWSADDCQDFRTRKRTTALMANVSFTNKGMLCKRALSYSSLFLNFVSFNFLLKDKSSHYKAAK